MSNITIGKKHHLFSMFFAGVSNSCCKYLWLWNISTKIISCEADFNAWWNHSSVGCGCGAGPTGKPAERPTKSRRYAANGRGWPTVVPQTFLSAVARAFLPAGRGNHSGVGCGCGAGPTGKSAERQTKRHCGTASVRKHPTTPAFHPASHRTNHPPSPPGEGE